MNLERLVTYEITQCAPVTHNQQFMNQQYRIFAPKRWPRKLIHCHVIFSVIPLNLDDFATFIITSFFS